MASPSTLSTDYINTVEYKKLEDSCRELQDALDDLRTKQSASRKLRYAEVDIEAERESGRLQPDELYVPQHIIDTNIRREQSAYVQYITQSPRAIILGDLDDSTIDLSPLERDLTTKLRYEGWQIPKFSNIDGFQANGYNFMEVVQDLDTPGEIAHEMIQYGDFCFKSDTRDIQAVEMTARTYYYTKTRLLALCGDGTKPEDWNRYQVDKVIGKEPEANQSVESSDNKDKSLYKVYKNMFRVSGTVHVAWSCPTTCDDWLRKPRPLYIGRRKVIQPSPIGLLKAAITKQSATDGGEQYETKYPYILYPYLISENDTIHELKGRVFLDQDLQEAVSSLMSSTVTKARRSAGLYFSKDVSDPNDDLLLQKNIFFRSGCLINSKVTEFQLSPPDPSMFNAIQSLVTAKQAETSQVNFAVNNRKDSRKTAEEVKTSKDEQAQLSTVQVVLYAIALTQMYRLMVDVIISRVKAGLIKVGPTIRPLYDRRFTIKPSGDIDVIERAKLINMMMQAWPVVQNTPAAQLFLSDLLELMFPERASRYIQSFQQANQQAQGVQAQQQQQLMAMFQQVSKGIINLAAKPEMFSETGKIHAFPIIAQAAQQFKELEQQQKQQPTPK